MLIVYLMYVHIDQHLQWINTWKIPVKKDQIWKFIFLFMFVFILIVVCFLFHLICTKTRRKRWCIKEYLFIYLWNLDLKSNMAAEEQIVSNDLENYVVNIYSNSFVNFWKHTIVLLKNVLIDVFTHSIIDIYLMMK